MNIYKSIAGVVLAAGMVVLSKGQARDRNHLLVKTDDSINSLNLSDAELELLEGAEGLAVYKLIGKTQFKSGEVFGYDGELNKALAKNMMPAEQAVVEVKTAAEESEEEIDEALVAAIGELDQENAAHFNKNNGKPELAVLKGLLKRNVTGKERDDAWSFYSTSEFALDDEDRMEALLAAIDVLVEDEFDQSTGKPSLDVLANVTETFVAGVERDNAWAEYQKSKQSDQD